MRLESKLFVSLNTTWGDTTSGSLLETRLSTHTPVVLEAAIVRRNTPCTRWQNLLHRVRRCAKSIRTVKVVRTVSSSSGVYPQERSALSKTSVAGTKRMTIVSLGRPLTWRGSVSGWKSGSLEVGGLGSAVSDTVVLCLELRGESGNHLS